MNIYIITIVHRKTGDTLSLRSFGNSENEAKMNARKFLNGNCVVSNIKLIEVGHGDS